MNSLSVNLNEVKLDAFEVLYNRNDEIRYMFIVKDGSVLSFKSTDGRIIPLNLAMNSGFIGEDAVFKLSHYDSAAIALEPTTLIKVKKSDIQEVLRNSPDWMKNLMDTLSHRLLSAEEILHEFKISDSRLMDNRDLDPGLEVKIKQALQNYEPRNWDA
jgi:CRP-like cAMP-binding protein